MRILCISIFLLIVPVAGWSAARDNTQVVSRAPDDAVSPSYSYYSDVYSNVMTIVRALTAPRSTPTGATQGGGSQNTGRVSPRTYSLSSTGATTYSNQPSSGADVTINNKQQYISFLKNSYSGNRSDCWDRYSKYNNFFSHDSTLSGQISAKDNTSSSNARLDSVCEFLDYSHWCFALGFAYGIRDFDNYDRTKKGYKCFTYQEFCESRNRLFDSSKVDEYLSKIIDEIVFYNRNIRNTDKNTVQVTTEKYKGSSMTTSSTWKSYDTDSWVTERIPLSEMTRLLCK